LKKGGREGFLGSPFQGAKVLLNCEFRNRKYNLQFAIFLIGRALQVLTLNFFDERGPVQVEQTGSLVLHPPRLDQGLKD